MLLIIQCYSYLRGDTLAPADLNITVSWSWRSTVSELENGIVGLYVPKSNQTILTCRCEDMCYLSVPWHWSNIWSMMWIFLPWFSEVRISGLSFIEDENEDISCSKGQYIIVQTIPFGAHNWKLAIKSLLIDDIGLLLNILARRGGTSWIGCYHFRWVP